MSVGPQSNRRPNRYYSGPPLVCPTPDCSLVYHHHHHHVVLVARISLTLSRHFSLSFIASGRSSGQHPVSSHSCWMYVRAGRPAFARPCVGVHKSTSLMSSSLLLQQCPACLVRLTWIVFVIGDRWPYSWCLVRCCRQDLFKIARSITAPLEWTSQVPKKYISLFTNFCRTRAEVFCLLWKLFFKKKLSLSPPSRNPSLSILSSIKICSDT